MPNNPYNLPTVMQGIEHIEAFIKVLREELELVDRADLQIFSFETVDARLLDYLADQFDMLGFNGWVLADTEEYKRELLKNAFRLHSLQGTRAGIIEVLKRLGFTNVQITEGWENFDDGSDEPDVNPWAHMKIEYELADSRELTALIAQNLNGLVETYKRASIKVVSSSYRIPPKDSGTFADYVEVLIEVV